MLLPLVAPEIGAPPLRRYAPPELVKATSPAAGASFSQTVNDGFWWRLIGVSARFTADANVANRSLAVEYRDDESVALAAQGNPVTYPASTTNEDFFWSVFQPEGAWEVGTRNLNCLWPLLLRPGWSFAVVVTNVQAGDTLTRVRYSVERFWPPSADDYPNP